MARAISPELRQEAVNTQAKLWAENLTKDERSLLLFLEARAIDYDGRVSQERMNADDFKIAQEWDEEGFISFGRICVPDISVHGAYWTHLSPLAWAVTFILRRERAERGWKAKSYQTTAEKRGAAA